MIGAGSQVNHSLAHPDVQAPASNWSESQTLHVASAYINPTRSVNRRQTFNVFRRQMSAAPNVRLYVGELAFGDRPFEVTQPPPSLDCQWRTDCELWYKENVLNQVIARFPPDWQYGAYVDGDFAFTRYDWALEAIHLLQHYEWVQLFSSYTNLTSDQKPMGSVPGFVYLLSKGSTPKTYTFGSPGGAWAFRRSAFNACGGLLDVCILGSADQYMAEGLAGMQDKRPETVKSATGYRLSIQTWQQRAAAACRRNISYLPCHAVHSWHGSKLSRGYGSRWKILIDNEFDPSIDLYRDSQGLWQLTPYKPALRDAIRAYFRSRNEDDPCLAIGERSSI